MLNDMKNLSAACTPTARPRSSWCAALVASIALAAAGLGACLAPPPAQAAEHTVSKEIGKTLQAAQAALHDRKYSEAIAKLKEADAFGKKTPWDQHIINVLAGGAYQGAKDYAEALKRYEAQLSDGFTSEAEQQKLVKAISEIAYQLQNYDKALEYGNKAIKGGFADDSIRTVVIQSYYQKRDYKAVQKIEEDDVAAQTKRGETPKQRTLELLQDACAKQGDKECQTRVFEKLVEYYPQPIYWETLLYDLSKTELPDAAKLQLFRLMLEVNVLKDNKDYTEMAQLAFDAGSPGESQDILEKGFAAKVFPDTRLQDKNKRLLEQMKKASADLMTHLPEKVREAESAADGEAYVKVGSAYFGFKQYDKAVDAVNKGLAKGGLPHDGAEARLLLGVAQLRGGHRDDAMKTFRAVKGDPTLERIGKLWALHAKQYESTARR
jgi:tetratricopeptide (TPR) repeat protein